MRTIITGGSGLIGRELAKALAAAGEEVVILSRRPEAVSGLPPGVRAQGWDGRTAQGWGHLVEGAAIVHLAGENIAAGRWTAQRKERIRRSRVESSGAVCAAIAAAREKPRVLLAGSAVGVYGPRGDEEITEEGEHGEDFLASVCVDWEAATAGVENLGVRRVILRTGVVLAREGGALPQMTMPFKFFAGGAVGSGEQWVSWIHLADEVGAIAYLLADEMAHGAFNLTAPQPLTNRDLSTAIGEAMGRPSFVPAPPFALRLLLGEMADILLEGQRVLPSKLIDAGYSFRFPDAESALSDLLV